MIRRTTWRVLAAVLVVTTAVSWALFRALASRGVTSPPVPWLVTAVLLLIAAVVGVLGWGVRQYQQGKRPTLDPLRAARTAALAKAASYTGALLAGWYGGQALVALPDLDAAGPRERAAAAGLAVLGSLVLAGVGLLAEWFCSIRPPKGGRPEEPGMDGGAEPAEA